MKKILYTLSIICVAFFYQRCGVIGMIEGGVKDSIAPVLIKALPILNAKHVDTNTKKIRLTYSKYIQVDNVSSINIYPQLKEPIEVDWYLDEVFIKMKDLKPHTTYYIDFKKNIKDLNEGNKADSLLYIFSTQAFIDSCIIKGKIINSATGDIDSQLNILLYDKKRFDSLPYKTKPDYVTKPNGKGEFTFYYLKNKPYEIVAINDKNSLYLYSGLKEKFAFYPQAVKAVSKKEYDSSLLVTLLAYQREEVKKEKNTYVKNKKLIKYQSNIENKGNVLMLDQNLELNVNYKIKKIDSNSVYMCDSSFLVCDLLNNPPQLDTLNQKIIFNQKWDTGIAYKLIICKNFWNDSSEYVYQKDDTLNIFTGGATDYKNVIVEAIDSNNINFKHPVLLLYNNKSFIFATIDKSFKIDDNKNTLLFNIKDIKKGEYMIKILDDVNNNYIWDEGNYIKNILPEKIYPIKQKLIIDDKAILEKHLKINILSFY